MPEWLNGAVSKTVECASAPGVRIPLSPPFNNKERLGDVAQLGEHLVRNEGVGGSSPLISTRFRYTGAAASTWRTDFIEIVLDGEVAVPSSPQSAIAGSKSRPRAFGVDFFFRGSGVDGQVSCNGLP